VTVARPKGVNLSESERIVLGDRALALKLAGLTYEEIGKEIGVHRNSVGSLLRDTAHRRAKDRDLTGEINRAIAMRQQVIEDLSRRMRALPKSGSQAAFAHVRLAEQVRKAQLDLLFLSGVEVPDPEQIIMDALEAMRVPIPKLSDLLSYPEMPTPRVISPTEEPPADPVIPEATPSGAADEDDGGDFRHFDPYLDY